jgi:hypothetical protein
MLSRQVFGAGEIIAIPLPNIGSMGGEYGRSEGATAENAVPFPGAARRLLNNRWWGYRGFMKEISRSNRIKNVVSLQLAREHARQPGGASNRHVSKRSNQRLLERLEAENAQLRGSVVDLMLQLQALRDGAR